MIIGFLINTCEPFYRGGYERRAWSFARELVRQGHEVRIYTSCSEDVVIEGVRFIRLGAPRAFFNSRGVRNGFADLIFAMSVLRLLWKLKAKELDVLDVCATPFVHLPAGAFVAWVKRIPLVLTCHEALLASLAEYVRERGHGGGLVGRMITWTLAGIYRLGMGLSRRRVAVSKRTAEALQREGFPAMATVEFGLEPDAFLEQEPKPLDGPVRFVFCGRLTPIKSVDQSLQTLLELRAEDGDFRFDIIGTGSELAKLKAMTDAAAGNEVVTFHGELSEQAKRDLFARSEVFILSSPREGFSIATLEAMAQGCCAVVANDPRRPSGALDFVRDGEQGLCVLPGRETMRDALRTVLRDSSLRLRLRQGAWKMASNYQIETQATRLAVYYALDPM